MRQRGHVFDLAQRPRGATAHEHGLVPQGATQRRNRLRQLQLSERPGGHRPHGGVAIAQSRRDRADGLRILELAESQHADLAIAGFRVFRQCRKLCRRPRRPFSRHHARRDAPHAAALVAQGGAVSRQRSRIHVVPSQPPDFWRGHAHAAFGKRHGHRHRHGHGRGHRVVAVPAVPPAEVRERASGQFAHRWLCGAQRGEQSGDGLRVTKVGLLCGQHGRKKKCSHRHRSRT